MPALFVLSFITISLLFLLSGFSWAKEVDVRDVNWGPPQQGKGGKKSQGQPGAQHGKPHPFLDNYGIGKPKATLKLYGFGNND
jgi:hypothetical protein